MQNIVVYVNKEVETIKDKRWKHENRISVFGKNTPFYSWNDKSINEQFFQFIKNMAYDP